MKRSLARDIRLIMEGQAILYALLWAQGVPEVWEPQNGFYYSVGMIMILLAVQVFLSTRGSIKLSGGTP
jgi:hypothetical protein